MPSHPPQSKKPCVSVRVRVCAWRGVGHSLSSMATTRTHTCQCGPAVYAHGEAATNVWLVCPVTPSEGHRTSRAAFESTPAVHSSAQVKKGGFGGRAVTRKVPLGNTTTRVTPEREALRPQSIARCRAAVSSVVPSPFAPKSSTAQAPAGVGDDWCCSCTCRRRWFSRWSAGRTAAAANQQQHPSSSSGATASGCCILRCGGSRGVRQGPNGAAGGEV